MPLDSLQAVSWSGVDGDIATIRWTAAPAWINNPSGRGGGISTFETYDITAKAGTDYVPFRMQTSSYPDNGIIEFQVRTLPHQKYDYFDEVIGIQHIYRGSEGSSSVTQTTFAIQGAKINPRDILTGTDLFDYYGKSKTRDALGLVLREFNEFSDDLYPILRKYLGKHVTKKDAKIIRKNLQDTIRG